MSIGNLKEQFLYERLPDAVINGDERGYIEALISGYQDRLEDIRAFAKKLDRFWIPGGLPDSLTANVVLVDLTSQNGKTYTRSLDLQADTPASDSTLLSRWVSFQLGVPIDDLSNVRYGYDALRAVDVNTLSWLATTLGTLLYQTNLLPDAEAVNDAQIQLVETWFPRLKIKGTVQSFEVLGRILGFDDVRVTPLWTRLSPRVPEDVGHPANDPDFAASPEYFPQQEIGPFYDPFKYRDGPFFSWSGTASNGTSSTQFYTQTITDHNPWIEVVLLGSLAGTNVPAIQEGTVIHPATGSYALSGGAAYAKAFVDPPDSSIRFQAVADGADFNGLFVHVESAGTLAVITVEDRLSAIKYRSSFFDLGLTADMERIEDIFGSRGATTNQDLKADGTLTSDGTAVSPWRPWLDGSIAVTQTTMDWVTSDGSITAVVAARRQADPSAPHSDRQLNMDEVVVAGVQATQAFEEVRAATRLPRRSLAGLLIDNQACYAPYTSGTLLFTTLPGVTVYSGSSTSSPLPDYVANLTVSLPAVFYCSWTGVAGVTYEVQASYNFAPFVTVATFVATVTGVITFYDPAIVFIALYTVLASGPPEPELTEGLISGGVLDVKSEINPLNQNEYLYGITVPNTSYTFNGSYNFTTGSYYFTTQDYSDVEVNVYWTLTSTEVVRSEPSSEVKASGSEGSEESWQFTCLSRPEDEANGLVYEMADDYPWRREIVIGGELVELDTYQSGSEIKVQEVVEATAFNDQTGVDLDVFGITSPNTDKPRIVSYARPSAPAAFHPGYLAIGYSGTLKNLSTLSPAEIEFVRPPTGVSVGDTETDYDVLFEPGYGLYHVGLAQGVLVADLPKFFGAHHSEGLVGWFACNEHVDDDLSVVDHSFRATPTELSGVVYSDRLWDSERGWHLKLSSSAQVLADEYRDVVYEITLGFWIKLETAPTVETRIVDDSLLWFTLKPGGVVSGYARQADGTALLVGSVFVGDGAWHFVYIRRSATQAVFGSGSLSLAATENNLPGAYAQGDAEVDTRLIMQAYEGAAFHLHDLRVWNIYKTPEEMDLVRYHAPSTTLCTYRLGFVYTLDRQDKYGVKILPSGWAFLDVLPAWSRRTRQGYVLRYDSMGSYHGETRFKEVGVGDHRPLPDTYLLGQQFVTLTAEGTAPFSTDHGQLPGWNALWQVTNDAGQYDVLTNSGSTAAGIAPVSTASGTVTPWPNTMTQTNPFRQYVFVSAVSGSGVYQLQVESTTTGSYLLAQPVAHGRTVAEITVDPYLAELYTYGTVYEALGTGFIQGTLFNAQTGLYYGTLDETTGTYGLYDPTTTVYQAKVFSGSDLWASDLPTGAYVLLSGAGTGVLLAHTGTHRGATGDYSGPNTTPPLYLYANSRIVAVAGEAGQHWIGRTATGHPPVTTPRDNDVDLSLGGTYGESLATVNVYGTYLNTPVLGRADVLEFEGTGPLLAGPHELTLVSGQIGQVDIDFDGFAVEISVNDTIFGRRLLRGYSGYNFKGTDTLEFDLEDSIPSGSNYLLTVDWTNPAEDTARGTKRQLALFSYRLREITTELFRVEVSPATFEPSITLLTTDYLAGTTPGGWFTAINSYGTRVGYEHESEIYTANDTVSAIYPLGDTLGAQTNERRQDVIYTGLEVVVAEAGSFVFPYFGSVAEVPVYNPPLWFWSGAMTANPSATIMARMSYESAAVRVALSETRDFGTRLYSDYVQATTANAQRARMTVAGLQAWTTYYYAVENAGSLFTDYIGTLSTFGRGSHSFSFGVAGCENNLLGVPFAANEIYPFLHTQNPLFLMHVGDWHYHNITTDDINLFRGAFDEVLSEAYHNQFYSQHPVVYGWDDHDFGGNDSDSTAASKPAARAAYRESVPHYPMAAGEGNKPIYYTFDVGRCRFIVTDNRSERTPFTVADSADKTVLGNEQKAWFKAQLLAASADPGVGAIFWVNSFPWSGTGYGGALPPRENWSAYPTERAEIATFIQEEGVQKVFILSGDSHSSALDDGRTYDFAVDGTNPYPGGQLGNGLPVFQAAPLAQTYSAKGEPYMIGPMVSAAYPVQQAGLVTIYDYGTQMLINFTSYDETGAILTSAGTELMYTLNGTASPRP